MPTDIKKLLSEATNGVLTEESYVLIGEAFNKALEAKVQIVEETFEQRQKEKEAVYSEHVQRLIDQIDEKYTKTAKLMLEHKEKQYMTAVKKIVSKYEKELNEQAKAFMTESTENVSEYLDLYLKESGVIQQIQESVNNTKAVNVLSSLRKVLAVDAAAQNEVITEGVKSAAVTIDASKKEVAALKDEKAALIKENAELARNLLINEKLSVLPTAKRTHMSKLLADKSVEYIKENFDYVSKLYDKTEQKNLDKLKQTVLERKEVIDDKNVVITEAVEPTQNESNMKSYLSVLGA